MTSFVPEDYARLVRLSSPALSPDGALAWVKYFWLGDKWQCRVELAEDGTESTVSIGGSRETRPVFSRDGRLLWFLSDGRPALHDRTAGITKEAFPLPEGFEAVDLLPLSQGGCVYVCRSEIRETAPEGCDWEMPLVTEEVRFRDDTDHGRKKKYLYRLCIRRDSVRVLSEGSGPFLSAALLPDESAVLYVQDGFKLISLSDAAVRPLDAPFAPGPDVRPAVAADGSYAMVAASCGPESCLRRLWLDGGDHGQDMYENEPDGLSTAMYRDASPERASLIAPGAEADTYYVSAMRGHIPMLWRALVRGERIVFSDAGCPGLAVETAGASERGIAVMREDLLSPARPFFLREGKLLPASPDPNAWIGASRCAPCHPVRTPSQDGRAGLGGFLLLPDEIRENIPLLVWVHGGPSGCWVPGFSLELLCAVSKGFAVLLPNPRGSTGRGNAYADPVHAFDGGAANDILCLLDEALRLFPSLDDGHVSILGGSYGGFMAAWMAGNTARFKCAVVIKAVTNWLFIHFKSSQAGQPMLDEYRDFQDFLTETVKASPIFSAGDVNIPTLIIHGEKDQQVPVENAHQFYTALRDCHPGLPVRLMLLPDCCHGYTRDPLENHIAIQRETLRWLDTYGKEKDL